MKYLIAVPCMDMIHTTFMTSLLNLKRPGDGQIAVSQSSLVYDSRNRLAEMAVKGGYDRVMWFDSDMSFAPDTMERLIADMDTGLDFVCGLCFSRKEPIVPCIYKALLTLPTGETKAIPYEPYPEGKLFDIEGAGLACAMVSTELIWRVFDRYGQPFSPVPGWGEDLSFCLRARDLGAKLWCDSRIEIGHIGQAVINADTYRQVRR